MKKGIVVVLAILLAVGAGFITPILMNLDREDYSNTTARNTAPSIITPATGTNSIVTISPEDVVPLVSTTPKYESDVKLRTPSPAINSQNTDVNKSDNKGVSSPNPVVSDQNKKEPSAEVTNNRESMDWVEKKIQEHRAEIDDHDLEDFRRIYSKVNIVYIQSIMNDGLDDEGMTKLKSYLRNTLGGDYERAKELFYKYSYLLSEV